MEKTGLFLELAQGKTEQLGKKGLGKVGNHESIDHSGLAPKVPVWTTEKLPEGQPSLQHSDLGFMLRVVRQKPLLTERHIRASLLLSNQNRQNEFK